ncbi:MAG: hypothetical protein P1P88_26340, partial [Bacteroidales bacterium]|nr:hypothetical protein [Bacteroidales bacterium]
KAFKIILNIIYDRTFPKSNNDNKFLTLIKKLIYKIKQKSFSISIGRTLISLNEESFIKLLSFKSLSVNRISQLYFYSNNLDNSFDYYKKVLKILLERNSNILIDQLHYNKPQFGYSSHDLVNLGYEFIWDLENYTELVESLLKFFIKYDKWHAGEALRALFPNYDGKNSKKAIEFLQEIIDKDYNNDVNIEIAFSIVAYKYVDVKYDMLKRLLLLNSNFELFKKLEITRHTQSWTGSQIPLIERDKKTWQDILELLEVMPNKINFLDHISYVQEMIDGCEQNKKYVMKREFIEDSK